MAQERPPPFRSCAGFSPHPGRGDHWWDGTPGRSWQNQTHHRSSFPRILPSTPTLTALENLTFFREHVWLAGKGITRPRSLSTWSIRTWKAARKKVAGYSAVMKRRVNLIAGLLHRPKVLFLDEPTVGIDVQLAHGHSRVSEGNK